MSDPESPAIFECDLGSNGGHLRFENPQQLLQWRTDELNRWSWAGVGGNQSEQIRSLHTQLSNHLNDLAQRWQHQLQAKRSPDDVLKQIEAQLRQSYCNESILNSASPKAEFLFKLRTQHGDVAACGAYAVLRAANKQNDAQFIQGVIEGFLYNREIEWTASAHQEQLNKLREEYEGKIDAQNKRSAEIEERNRVLNDAFEVKLDERTKSLDELRETKEKILDELHARLEARFQESEKQNKEDFKSALEVYDKTLALQKPVEYWEVRQKYHGKLAKGFGITSLVIAIAVGGGMGWLIHWIFSGLIKPDSTPPHWHLGVLAVAAFFSIWMVRIFVRLFFSNLHLATDAAERRVMIQTFLSMAREGSEFAPEDKTLIVQHLFRSASDGLVKDDAAPPSLWSIFQK